MARLEDIRPLNDVVKDIDALLAHSISRPLDIDMALSAVSLLAEASAVIHHLETERDWYFEGCSVMFGREYIKDDDAQYLEYKG